MSILYLSKVFYTESFIPQKVIDFIQILKLKKYKYEPSQKREWDTFLTTTIDNKNQWGKRSYAIVT